MAWIYLFIAGLMEVAWAVGLKLSEGFSRPWITVYTIIMMVLSFVFLSIALKSIAVGTGYAVWTGIGVIGTAVIGMIFLAEPVSVVKICCILLIISGIIGLRLIAE